MPRMFTFKFIHSATDTHYVDAPSKKDAIEIFHKRHGIPYWFIHKHFKIKKVWRKDSE